MKYQSTRNRALTASPAAAVLAGIAPDGGLYMPEAIPVLDWQSPHQAGHPHHVRPGSSLPCCRTMRIWTLWFAGAIWANSRRRI